jgi:SAM-dependent methyltransferase
MPNFKPHAHLGGGFSPTNGTIDFYLRVSSYLHSEAVVVDLGAGRGAWYHLEQNPLIRKIRDIKPHVKALIGVDVDPAVMTNPTTTENRVMEGDRIPLDDGSADVIFADYVIEHIDDPDAFKAEIDRVLKPGGVFCARTPHAFSYVALVARMVPNARHASLLKGAQPHRQDVDVFPTRYKMNTLAAIKRIFPGWQSGSFIYRTDPSYFFGSAVIYRALEIIQRIMPRWFSGNLMIFLLKP